MLTYNWPSGRDQLALAHHFDHGHVGAFIEELGGREVEDAVVLHHDQEAVLGPAHAVGVGELQARRKRLHLVGHAVAVAVGHGPHGGLARAHEKHVGAGRHGHVAGVGHHGVKLDAEAGRQLDALEIRLDGVGVLAGLRHLRDVEVGGGDLHLLELFDVRLRGGRQGHTGHQGGSGEQAQGLCRNLGHGRLLEFFGIGLRAAGRRRGRCLQCAYHCGNTLNRSLAA
jgi:hypothetical protein